MRKFIDLHLCPNIRDSINTGRLIKRASELGYKGVGIALPLKSHKRDLSYLKKRCSDLGLDFISRVDLTPKNARDLLMDLRRVRKTFEIVAVNCYSKDVARQAAKDHRVDLLSFSMNYPHKRFFDRAEAELASNASASLEIDITAIITSSDRHLVNLLSTVRREIEISRKFDVKVVFSSGASDPLLMRGPKDYVSIAKLLDVDREFALKTLSDNPLSIIQKNRRKLKENYIAPGVYIVERPKDG